jgi:hypothetical protein
MSVEDVLAAARSKTKPAEIPPEKPADKSAEPTSAKKPDEMSVADVLAAARKKKGGK